MDARIVGELSAAGANPRAKPSIGVDPERWGMSAFDIAWLKESEDCVVAMLPWVDVGVAWDERRRAGAATLLIECVDREWTDAVRCLVEVANLAERCPRGLTALTRAAQLNNVECVRMLATKETAGQADDQGISALGWAAMEGHADCVASLLAFGGAQQASKSGATPLMEAAGHGMIDCVELLRPWSDARARDMEGRDALMRAAGCAWGLKNALVCAKALAPASDLAIRAKDGRSALMIAAERGMTEMALLCCPAEERHVNGAGMREAAKLARGRGFKETARAIEARRLAIRERESLAAAAATPQRSKPRAGL